MSDVVNNIVFFVVLITVLSAYIILLIYFAKRENKNLSTRWLWFYTHIRLLLGMLFTIPFLLGSIVQYHDNPLTVIIYTGIFLLLLSTYLGLSKREWWGWYANWLVLIMEVMLSPFLGKRAINTFGEYLMIAGVCTLWWFLPNAIYFGKRKCLFLKRREQEVLENANIDTLKVVADTGTNLQHLETEPEVVELNEAGPIEDRLRQLDDPRKKRPVRRVTHIAVFVLCILCGIGLVTLVATVHFHIYDNLTLRRLLNQPNGLYWAARGLPTWTIPLGLGLGLVIYFLGPGGKMEQILKFLIARTRQPTRRQWRLIVLWVCIALIAFMCMFPPLQGVRGQVYYDFVISASTSVDIIRLIVQCLPVAIIAGGLLYSLRDKPTKREE